MAARLVAIDPDHEYKGEVVEKLEGLLIAAKEGKILSIVYACEQPGAAVTTGCSRIKDRYNLLGYLAYAMHRTCRSIDDDAEPSDLAGEE